MIKIKDVMRRFSHDDHGAIAPTFGVLLLVMLVMMGVSIDGARTTRAASAASAALDAAALAGAQTLRLENPTDAELTTYVQKYFDNNYTENELATLSGIEVIPDRVINSVRLIAQLQLPATFTVLLGKKKLDVKVESTAVFDVKDVEVSMMLDVSGSMAGSKLQDLQAAAVDLVDIMLPSGKPHNNKVAIAPFSTSVNAGALAALVTDKKGKGKGKGGGSTCVTERNGSHAFTDRNPLLNPLRSETSACPASAVVPLTNDVDELHDAIDDLTANGMTAGHLGIAWAWYLLSPNWAPVLPSDSTPVSYDEPTVRKVAILMTDGMFNSTYEAGNGSAVEQARKLCKNMKAEGVTVFTVGFQVPEEVVSTLEYCATSPKHWYRAEDGATLRKTFKDIANRLNGLRLSS